MRFVFWQNVVSIHQSAFIKALSEVDDVTLVAAEEIDAQRRKEKWNVPSMGRAKVIVSPSESQIASLFDMSDVHHVYSGINSFPMVYKAFKGAISRGLHVSVMLEPYEWAGVKGFLRRLMYAHLHLRYGKFIDHVFATGNMGIRCYRKTGFPRRKLHQWGYFTEQYVIDSEFCEKNELDKSSKGVKLLYVGRIDHNKNILKVLKDFDQYGEWVNQFTIVGDGPLMEELRTMAQSNQKIQVMGRRDNKEISQIMARHDYLVLPSLYDGWGAVVNESLAAGTPVLCSEACGASILLDGAYRGESFSQSNMVEIIKKRCMQGAINENQRQGIKSWANTHISGKIAADYFSSIIQGKSINAPWLEYN